MPIQVIMHACTLNDICSHTFGTVGKTGPHIMNDRVERVEVRTEDSLSVVHREWARRLVREDVLVREREDEVVLLRGDRKSGTVKQGAMPTGTPYGA